MPTHSSIKSMLISSLLVFWSSHLFAESNHHHDHGAHVHGEASLAVVMEGKTVAIEFESPAVNLVGFEHPAQSQEEIDRVEHVEHLLQSADELFRFIQSRCIQKSIDVDVSSVHNNEHQHSETHSEIASHYVFMCDDIKKLQEIDVVFFKHFPSLQHINVMLVTETKQKAMILTQTQSLLHLR